MVKNRKVHVYFCVTNDVSYDQRVQKISGALSASGYNVTIVGRKLEPNYIDVGLNGVEIERLNCHFLSGPAFYLEYNLRLFFYFLFSRAYDGICACDPDTLFAATCVTFLRSKVLIYDSHELFTEVPELNKSPLKKFVWSSIESLGCRWAQLRYTVGHALAQILSEKYHSSFEVIRNVSNLPTIETNPNRSNIILYQGVLNVGRGLEVAIEAMDLLPDYELWICGEGDISHDLRTQASKAKVGNIKFLGKLMPHNLREITGKAKYGLNLLDKSSLNYYYSLANKFFDYSAFGVVSINMNFPEYSILQQSYPCSILINELSKDEIVSAIKSDENWIEKSNQALNMARNINWESEKKHLLELYEKVFQLK